MWFQYDQLCSGTLFSLFSFLFYTTCQKVFSSLKMKNLLHEKLDRLWRVKWTCWTSCSRGTSLWLVLAALHRNFNQSINQSINQRNNQRINRMIRPLRKDWCGNSNPTIKWKLQQYIVCKIALSAPVRVTAMTHLGWNRVTWPRRCERTDCGGFFFQFFL